LCTPRIGNLIDICSIVFKIKYADGQTNTTSLAMLPFYVQYAKVGIRTVAELKLSIKVVARRESQKEKSVKI
jgi:hypothetical protein